MMSAFAFLIMVKQVMYDLKINPIVFFYKKYKPIRKLINQ